VITGGIGEPVDPLLVHDDPVGHSHFPIFQRLGVGV